MSSKDIFRDIYYNNMSFRLSLVEHRNIKFVYTKTIKIYEMRAQEAGWASKLTLVLCFSCWRRHLGKSPWHSLTSFLSHLRRIVADIDGLINSYCTCSDAPNFSSDLIFPSFKRRSFYLKKKEYRNFGGSFTWNFRISGCTFS